MPTTNINNTLIETYIGLFENLNFNTKLELISRLTSTMKSLEKTETVKLDTLFGAFISKQSAEELSAELKQARFFKRKRVSF